MLNRTKIAVAALVVLFSFPLFAAVDYKVVIKKNGKIIEGQLVSEDDSTVTIVSRGARLTYNKEQLDLEKMKELNAGRDTGGAKTLVIHSKTQGQTQTKKNQTALTDVVKQNREAQSTHASNTVDTVGNALAAWVEELEEKANMTPSTQMQMQLSKAKKALNFYRARNDREFSQTDRRLLLEQQVNALDFVYTKQLEAGAPDNKTAELKQKIDQTKKELADLDKK